MRNNYGLILPGTLLFLFGIILFFSPLKVMAEEDYSFEWGGYSEIKWDHINLDTDSKFYRLNFYKDPHSALDRFTGALQVEGHYKKGIWSLNGLLRAEGRQDDIGWSDTADVFEALTSDSGGGGGGGGGGCACACAGCACACACAGGGR